MIEIPALDFFQETEFFNYFEEFKNNLQTLQFCFEQRGAFEYWMIYWNVSLYVTTLKYDVLFLKNIYHFSFQF